jgi:metal-sulfur cluster biosynthetic enzyme
MTLEELMVVSSPQVSIKQNIVDVEFTPTVPHCGASTLIGQHTRSICIVCQKLLTTVDGTQVYPFEFDYCAACLSAIRSIYM